MSDRRYSTARWQRLRKAVLAHYGYVCQVEGPRCTGYATTVHHLVPSSQAPHLFWEPSNLAAACGRCNYGGGSRIAAENTRRTINDLRALVEEHSSRSTGFSRRSRATKKPTAASLHPVRRRRSTRRGWRSLGPT
jgi:5-methylcytosine-specific restriction endonuclease McrA